MNICVLGVKYNLFSLINTKKIKKKKLKYRKYAKLGHTLQQKRKNIFIFAQSKKILRKKK